METLTKQKLPKSKHYFFLDDIGQIDSVDFGLLQIRKDTASSTPVKIKILPRTWNTLFYTAMVYVRQII